MPAWLVLALLLSLSLALSYQLATRRFGWRVLGYWALILVAFVAGEVLAESIGWNFLRLGDLRILPALLAALVMVGALWFVGL